MAGDWIKMRVDLADDPAVIAIAAATGLDEDGVVGRLHRLWGWADRQTTDGDAPGVTEMWIDRYLRCDGFAAAMVAARWLEVTQAGVTLPRFERHNGQTGKRRALTAARMKRQRGKCDAQSGADGDAASVTESAPREEKSKRRVDISDAAHQNRAPAFVPPTVDEVRAYAVASDLPDHAAAFCDYFKSNGWKVGGRAKMQAWESSYNNWCRNEPKFSGQSRNGHHRVSGASSKTDRGISAVKSFLAEEVPVNGVA